MADNLRWLPGEKPTFAFCESVWASGPGPWHIRKVGEAGLKLGGGIDTPSLCNTVRPFKLSGDVPGGAGGWDLDVRILPRHLEPAPPGERPLCCRTCAAEYLKGVSVVEAG